MQTRPHVGSEYDSQFTRIATSDVNENFRQRGTVRRGTPENCLPLRFNEIVSVRDNLRTDQFELCGEALAIAQA